jgi:hypothetical protein
MCLWLRNTYLVVKDNCTLFKSFVNTSPQPGPEPFATSPFCSYKSEKILDSCLLCVVIVLVSQTSSEVIPNLWEEACEIAANFLLPVVHTRVPFPDVG